MADIRIKDLATTAASTASDDFVAVDGSANGTRKLNAYSPTFGGNLTTNGVLTVVGNVANIQSSSGVESYLRLNQVGTTAWDIRNIATSGALYISNSGSDWITIAKTTGATVFNGAVTAASTLAVSGNLTVSGTGTSSIAGILGVGTSSPQSDAGYGGLSINGTSGGILTFQAANTNKGRIYSSASAVNIDANAASNDGIVYIRSGSGSTVRASFDSTGTTLAGNLTVSGTGTSSFAGQVKSTSADGFTANVSSGNTGYALQSGSSAFSIFINGADSSLRTYSSVAGGTVTTLTSGGNLLLGTTTDSANGKLQLATHTTSAGGIGFGTATSLYTESAGTLSLNNSAGDARLYFYNTGVAQGKIESASSNFYVTASAGSLILRSGGPVTALTLDSSQNATFAGKLTTKGSSLSATENVNVSTTAVDLAIATSVGGLYFVSGYNASGGAQGTWLVMARGTVVTTISSDNNTGLTVTFSMSSGKLQAATASGTLVAHTTAITR